jgi:hypothetical protein
MLRSLWYGIMECWLHGFLEDGDIIAGYKFHKTWWRVGYSCEGVVMVKRGQGKLTPTLGSWQKPQNLFGVGVFTMIIGFGVFAMIPMWGSSRPGREKEGWRERAVDDVMLRWQQFQQHLCCCCRVELLSLISMGRRDRLCRRNYKDKSRPCDRHASKDVLYTEGPRAQDLQDSVSILYGATAVDDAFFNNMCAPWTSAVSLLTD